MYITIDYDLPPLYGGRFLMYCIAFFDIIEYNGYTF